MKRPSYMFFGGNVLCVSVHFLFLLPLIFTLVAASISHFLTAAIKFSCFSSNEIGLFCFLLTLFLALSLFYIKPKEKFGFGVVVVVVFILRVINK